MKRCIHMRRGLRWTCRSAVVIAVVSTLALFSTASWAEFYFGGAVGGNFPFGLNDVKLKSVNNQPVDIQLEDSLAYGGKAGYFFSSVDWLGVEVEAFNSNPNFKPTTVTVGGFPVNVGAIDLRVTTAAANLVARYPGNRFEPYIGIGPGAFVARISRGGNSQTSVVPGLNVIGEVDFTSLTGLPCLPSTNSTMPGLTLMKVPSDSKGRTWRITCMEEFPSTLSSTGDAQAADTCGWGVKRE